MNFTSPSQSLSRASRRIKPAIRRDDNDFIVTLQSSQHNFKVVERKKGDNPP
jgi:hypothetical protein